MLVADGTALRIRPARSSNREQVLRLYQGLSTESLRFRFVGPSRRLVERAAAKACSPPRDGYLALVADDGRQIVRIAECDTAVGRSCDPRRAETALAVADDWHRHGVGRLLVEQLGSVARAEGVRRFTADALAENPAVLQMFHDLGLPVSWRPDDTEVHCTLSLEQDADYSSAVETRGRITDVADMRPLLRPSSIAVRDLAVPAVPEVTKQRGRRGMRSLVTVAFGLGAAEAWTQSAAARAHWIRLMGPACPGIADSDADGRMAATLAAHRPLPDTAGVAVQSGGVGIALLVGLSRLGIGVSTFVALGDTYDVSGPDLLQYWETDERTTLTVLHLESLQYEGLLPDRTAGGQVQAGADRGCRPLQDPYLRRPCQGEAEDPQGLPATNKEE
ncbi:GNAT family N-acetyltransferase [Streptomyces umbrinus]|uniref:GNAT family N-acetyltransferase n=1 Tax=Streptomyces umbrinus TaxID=67370 RepID=UPI003405DE31